MRAVILGLIVSISLLAPASGAQGYRAKVTTTISLSDSFFKAIDPHGRSGLSKGDFTIPPVTGMLYLAGSRMRVDMNAPMGTLTTIYDGPAGYVLDNAKPVAWKLSRAEGESGELPLFNLDQFAVGWSATGQQLSKAGLSTRRLGQKKIGGLSCTGTKYSGDIRKLLDADEVQVVPGLPPLSSISGSWTGTVWVSDKLGVPVRMTSSFSGIDLTWQLTDVQAADIPETMLKLPPGYKVRDPEPNQSAVGAT